MSPSSTKPANDTGSRAASTKPPGHLNSIAKTLRKRAAQTRTETEKLLQSELQSLSESLKESVREELNTINSDIKEQSKDLSESLSESIAHVQKDLAKLRKSRRRWPLVLSVLAIICASSFATVRLQSFLTEKDLAAKQSAIRTMDETLSKAKTWGVTFSENQNGRFIILHPGLELRTGFKAGKNEAAQIVKK